MSEIPTTVFLQVLAKMKAAHVSQEALAAKLRITPRSLRNKLQGKTPLTLDEAIAIRDSLSPEQELEVLFRKG